MPNPEVFAIELDRPDGLYSPGMVVSGRVVVVLLEPLVMRRLRLSFIGRARVAWTEGSGDNRRHVSDEEGFFDQTITLFGNPPDAPSNVQTPVMPTGQHVFNFAFTIPLTRTNGRPLPGKYSGDVGDIRYIVKAHIERPTFRFDRSVERDFTLRAPVYNLNLDPAASKPIAIADGKTVCCWCCRGGRIGVLLRLPKAGYVVGEVIAVWAEVINHSCKTITDVRLFLSQRRSYKTRRGNHREFNEVLAESSKMQAVQPGATQKWENEGLLVPPTVTTLLPEVCRVIEISYSVDLEVVPDGCSMRFEVKAPIIVGTIPLAVTGPPPPPPPLYQ